VAQVPDRQDVVAALRGEEGRDRREVVDAAPPIDQGPGNALARHGDAERRQHRIILVGVAVVAKLGGKVAAAPVLAPQESRAFEARQEEGREDALAIGHGGDTRQMGPALHLSP
jgi:hypothetical protein